MLNPLREGPRLVGTPAASTQPLLVRSGGCDLLGVIHRPAGPGPHPVVVLLHGFPGWERNFDLAQALRRAGHATVVFHYRGSWGSPGSWSWWNGVEDGSAVTRHLIDRATDLSLDPHRVALVGHSFGGFVALQVASDDPAIQVAVSIAGFDFEVARQSVATDPSSRGSYEEAWAGELAPLSGTSATALVDEMLRDDRPWSLRELAPKLTALPLLLVGTDRDPVTPAEYHHRPLVAALKQHHAEGLEHLVLPTDHALSDHRIALARRVSLFLGQHL